MKLKEFKKTFKQFLKSNANFCEAGKKDKIKQGNLYEACRQDGYMLAYKNTLKKFNELIKDIEIN